MALGIVAAGGYGERLESEVPKPEVELLGQPLLMYALTAFQGARSISGIIVVVPPGRLGVWPLERVRRAGISKAMSVVAGGATRQESVSNALGAIPEHEGIVVVHDAARPAVTPEMIDDASLIPPGADGVITAVPVTDTIKRVEDGVVERTIDRSRLAAVQTPQAFELKALRKAHRLASESGFTGTDDASLVERMGGKVLVRTGDRENIKVTFPGDIARAEAIILARREH
ncbi:MAG: 2-C-methyl-D-erythritol 4-phosphate cytidylyltransferase [Actinobacteria bacterium]|nr:2-C-methyl-D-erythritol 4-phosphate cytidylyltransferase [Actinomycetota bacterium]MCG2795618.1 2-C-methyl-D-erythritol 4-phosphate cytidylyltransferase [Actinomycetes bacterium]